MASAELNLKFTVNTTEPPIEYYKGSKNCYYHITEESGYNIRVDVTIPLHFKPLVYHIYTIRLDAPGESKGRGHGVTNMPPNMSINIDTLFRHYGIPYNSNKDENIIIEFMGVNSLDGRCLTFDHMIITIGKTKYKISLNGANENGYCNFNDTSRPAITTEKTTIGGRRRLAKKKRTRKICRSRRTTRRR
jgi:hypothetical protein